MRKQAKILLYYLDCTGAFWVMGCQASARTKHKNNKQTNAGIGWGKNCVSNKQGYGYLEEGYQ